MVDVCSSCVAFVVTVARSHSFGVHHLFIILFFNEFDVCAIYFTLTSPIDMHDVQARLVSVRKSS